MLKRCETGLNSFFVFNSTYGLREGEVSLQLSAYNSDMNVNIAVGWHHLYVFIATDVYTVDTVCRKPRKFCFIIQQTWNLTQKFVRLACVKQLQSSLGM